LKWIDDVMQEAVQVIKEKHFSLRRSTEAPSVSVSCLQRRCQGIKMNILLKEHGGQDVFS